MESDTHNSHPQRDGSGGISQNGNPQSPVVRAPASRASGHGLRALRPLLTRRTGPVTPRTQEGGTLEGGRTLLIASTIVSTIVITFILAVPLQPAQVDIQPGTPAATDIISPAYLSYASKVLTDQRRKEAADDTANEVSVQDTDLIQSQRTMMLNALAALQDARAGENLDINDKRQRLLEMAEVKLTPAQVDMLLAMTPAEYTNWRDNAVIHTFDAIMKERRIASDADVREARVSLPALFPASFTQNQNAAATAFISPFLSKNMRLDAELTQQRREQAAANIKPVIQTVQKGEAILRRGDLAYPEAIEKMQAAGLLSGSLSASVVVGTLGVVSLLMVLLHLYVYRFAQQVWKRPRQLLLVAMLVTFTVGVARFVLPGHTLLPYLLPVAAVSMLLAVLLDRHLAVVVTFVLAMLLGIMLGNVLSMEMPLYYFVGGLAGVFTLTRVEKVGAFARAGFYIGITSFLAAFMIRVLVGGPLDWTSVGQLAAMTAVNGVVSASITFAAFSLLGTLFGITTPLQLMELAHPDQPLLRRLMHEAPGTYHHSLVVSNLAEHAAETIGADPLLTRVCAYYHDIGKSERPYYFIDNQSGLSNLHEQMSPWESARIIALHVEDGIRLGEKGGLPKRVLDAIPQHHGTMLIKFFYYKALEQDPHTNPDDFRYPGPKPQTKENAILMLADGVEAAVRSMAQNGGLNKQAAGMGDLANRDASESPVLYNNTASMTEDAISAAVHKIIGERIEDGQLDECDLTVRDIARIHEAFVTMLKGIYHPRVPYPEAPKIELTVETLER